MGGRTVSQTVVFSDRGAVCAVPFIEDRGEIKEMRLVPPDGQDQSSRVVGYGRGFGLHPLHEGKLVGGFEARIPAGLRPSFDRLLGSV